MVKENNYKFTIIACCLGSVLMSAITNVTPLLFIPLREIYGLSYGELGFLVSANFVTQFICDFSFGAPADKFGVKKFLVAAPICTVLGFIMFSLSPYLFKANPYIGFILSTVLFSAGGGLLELLVSPVVNALPFENKAATMSKVHSFYAWGQVLIVLITTIFIKVFGRNMWQFIYVIWAVLGILSTIMFIKSPMLEPQKGDGRSGMRGIIFKPMFLLSLLLMFGGGSSEIGLCQWASSFMEKGMNIPKEWGDILGMCIFGILMGTGRTLYAKNGEKIRIMNVLMLGAALAAVSYIAVAISPSAVISLVFCAICGIAVSLLWPCTLSITAEYFPYGGTLMFAILAGGGDIGCSAGPWLMGYVMDLFEKMPITVKLAEILALNPEQVALRAGVLSGAVFPLVTFIGLIIFKINKEKTDVIK